jgi:hypothetical protein
MSVTAQTIFNRTMVLYAQTKKDGTIDTAKTTEYTNKAIPLINQILQDIAYIEGNNEVTEITALTDFLDILDNSAVRVMPWGLGQLFALGDNDSDMFGYFSTKYEYEKSKIKRPEFKIKDEYDILNGMR